jgi:vacuolar-type H+-ATPase subunit F/Vma7
MAEQSTIVALGPRAEMIGLRTVGIEMVEVQEPAELPAALREHAGRAEVALVIVSETVAEQARLVVQELRERTETPIMLVPSHRGSRGITLEWMRRAMEQSIGVDVISED